MNNDEICGVSTLPVLQGEALVSSYQENIGPTVTFEFFKSECMRNGHSVKQVLKVIRDGPLPILTPDKKRITVPSFLNEKNLPAYLKEQGTIFPELHTKSFWEKTEADNGGGWDTAYETSDSSLPVTTLLRLQEDISQANKERDQFRLELEEARKKLQSRPPDVKRWKDSITAIVAGFMKNVLTQAERQSIITRLQGKKRADIVKMWADSQVLGEAEDAFWAGLWADVPEHLRPKGGRPKKN